MIKAKNWKGDNLEGEWTISLKIDGVRMLRDSDGNPVSRAGKPLHNLEGISADVLDAEVYLGSWEDSVSAVRTHNGTPVTQSQVYPLDQMDERLYLDTWTNPSAYQIKKRMTIAVAAGYEGLVLRQGDKWIKVKPKETYDVKVTGVQEGKGQHEGAMGALLTDMGKVGTGFTREQRKQVWRKGNVIEVECMSLTPKGKFRHPRFVRERFDK